MLSNLHELFLVSLRSNILKQLEEIQKDDTLPAAVAKELFDGGSADIILEDGGTRSPDFMIRHKEAVYPILILEVAYSQITKKGRKSLRKLADHYIVESSGNIRTVIGIYLDYKASKKATLSIWRPVQGEDAEGEYLSSKEVVQKEVCK